MIDLESEIETWANKKYSEIYRQVFIEESLLTLSFKNSPNYTNGNKTNQTLRTKRCNEIHDMSNNISTNKWNNFTKNDLHNYSKCKQGYTYFGELFHGT